MRVNIPELDEVIDLYFPMLDGSGFIALKDYMGSDQSVLQAARNSYSKGTKKVSDDRSLLRRLMRDHHDSPFEFAELEFHVRAPLYVIQQWLRHRTNNFCQESHRFSEIKDDFQKTDPVDWRLQDQKNKQGSGGLLIESETVKKTVRDDFGKFDVDWTGEHKAKDLTCDERELHKHLRKVYDNRIELGVAREQARKDIPHSTYSSIYIKSDLRNLLHFLKLRTAKEAQLEIRVYADMIAGFVKRLSPLIFESWIDYSYSAKSFSRLDIQFLNYMHRNYSVNNNHLQGTSLEDWELVYKATEDKYHEEIGFTKTELASFWQKISPIEIPSFDLDLTKANRME